MISRSLLILILSATPALAEPLIFYGGGGTINTNLEEPVKLTFNLSYGPFFNPMIIEAGEIHGVTPTNGTVWRINESNASSYGFDWAAAESGILHLSDVAFRFSLAADVGGPFVDTGTSASDFLGGPYNFRSNPGSNVYLVQDFRQLGTFDMTEIQLHLRRWTLQDKLRLISGSYSAEWIIVGEGTFRFIPEPSSIVLFAASVLLALPFGRRRVHIEGSQR